MQDKLKGRDRSSSKASKSFKINDYSYQNWRMGMECVCMCVCVCAHVCVSPYMCMVDNQG